MCGLVGIYSSNLMMKHKEVLTTLLYLDTFRGRDSTGVAAIRYNADTATLKSTVPGYEFIEGNRLDQHLQLRDFCWIGHNRFGTMGKNTRANAHPFEILDEDGTCLLVGAHNGTLKNKHVLNDHAQFGTDSEALFNHMAFNGIDKTVEILDGAWALTWYDHVEENLHFLRNKERTLFYCYEEGKKTLFWASEEWMLRVAISRAGLKIDEGKVYVVNEDTLYTFPAPEKMNDQITKETRGGLVGKTFGFFQGTTNSWVGGRHGQRVQTHQSRAQATATNRSSLSTTTAAGGLSATSSQSGTTTQTSGEKPTTSNEDSSSKQPSAGNGNVVSIEAAKTYKGYKGKTLSKAELETQLENGCGWCELEFIDISDRYAWLDHGKPICGKCIDGTPDVKPVNNLNVGVTVH